MREADWSLHAVTERTMATERRTAAVRHGLGWSAAACFVVGCPLSSLLGVFLQLWRIRFDPTPLALPLTGLALLLGLAHRHWRRKDESLLRAQEGILADDYAAMDGWIVDLRIVQGKAISGRDRGVVWFEEGRLYFTGERTSFGLESDQALAPLRHEAFSSDSTLRLPLTLRTAAGPVTLGFDLVSTRGTGWRNRPFEGLVDALRAWRASPARAPGEGQWPPLSLGPGSETASSLFGSAVLVTAVWLALAAFVVLSLVLSIGTTWLVVLPALVLLCRLFGHWLPQWLAPWTPHRHWRAWRDRRRLEVRR